jgi:tetratricopeptide (TPR) repeat protein
MAASLLAIALLGAALTIWQAFQAAAARDSENQARLALSTSKQAVAEERANEIARQLETLNKANSLIESARSHVDFSEWDKAEADLNQALVLRKDHSSIWATRGDIYARLDLWDLAAADFQQAYTLQEPGSIKSLYLHGLLRLHMRDEAGYRKTCEVMARRFGEEKGPRAWEREEVARVCLHAQSPVISPDRLIALTERATESLRSSVRLASLGTALYRAGQYDLALLRLTEARDFNPQLVSVWTNSVLAMTHFRFGQPERARSALESAAKELARRFAARARSVASEISMAWWLEVEEDLFFREATLLIEGHEPHEDPRRWYARAQALVMLGRPKEAISNFTRAAELDPKYTAAFLRRSELFFRIGDWENLFKDLEQRRSLEPNDPQVANDLSWGLATCPIPRYRDQKRAIELANLAVKLVPASANFWNTLGVVEYRGGDWKRAEKATLKSMELSRGATFFDWYTLALCQWRLNRRELARQLLIYAYRRTPPDANQDPSYLEIRNEAAALIGERESTGPRSPDDPSAYTLLLELEPEAAWIYQLRATACIQLKQWDQAAADLARVTDVRPKDHRAWYEQAAARLGAGDLEGYRKARRRMIALFREGSNDSVVGQVCYVSAAVPGEPEEAAILLRMAEHDGTGGPRSPRLRGAINFRAGNYEAAIACFNQAAPTFPRRAWDWLFLAMSHQKLGHIDEARRGLAEAVTWIERTDRGRGGGSTPTWFGWYESLEVAQILKEAKQLIQ